MASSVAVASLGSPASTRKRWAFRARGLMGTLVVALFGAPAILSPLHAPPPSWGSTACFIAGWFLFVAGALFRFWPTLYIGGRKLHQLACEGPYSIVRNPLYLGTFLIWAAGAVWLQSLTLLLGVLIGIGYYAWFAVPAEEAQLRATLGEPYEQYLREVPRFIPRFSLYRSPQSITVQVHGLVLECRRAARWICLPIGVEILNQLRLEAWWPVWCQLP